MTTLLNFVEHRSYPPPKGAWVMTQTWDDLLFAHWPVKPAAMQALLPHPLLVDTFEGSAWIAVVPFLMTGVRARLTPALPYLSRFLELNVRTYVRLGQAQAVYFFSLDAQNPLAVEAARAWFQLPYMHAFMSLQQDRDWTVYNSERKDRRSGTASLSVRYRPLGEVFNSEPGGLEHFLTERYCLLADYDGGIIRGDIHHKPWPLQRAEADFSINTMLAPLGISAEDKPHLLYSRSIETIEWAPSRLAV